MIDTALQQSESVKKESLINYRSIVIINSGSGTLDAAETIDAFKSSLPELDILKFYTMKEGMNYDEVMSGWFSEAANQGCAVIVAGGDGTLSLGVKHAIEKSVPLAVVGMGTFNLFAQHYNLSLDPLEQLENLRHYGLAEVSMCFANDMPFTTSAAFGLYPEIIEEREHYQEQFGFRSQATGYLAGLLTFLKNRPSMVFKLMENGKVVNHRSLVFMATHNRIHLENLGFSVSNEQLEEKFALVSINPATFSEKLRLILKGSFGNLNEDARVHLVMKNELKLDADAHYLDCAIDGEIVRFETPVTIERRKNALKLFLP